MGIPKMIECLATLSPEQPNFARFAHSKELSGIRMNNLMNPIENLKKEFGILSKVAPSVPLFSDVKGRQIRVVEALEFKDHLELIINHPIETETPMLVLFKAGTDDALLKEIKDGGRRLVFQGGPCYKVRVGESLHIRHPSFAVVGDSILPEEKEKIALVRNAGIKKFFLSYVEKWQDIDELREVVGTDAELWLKIETVKGLQFVSNEWKKQENLTLVAARGDLYVEVEKPHHIIDALKLIIEKDPEACVGSRILLSLTDSVVPSCADLFDIAWLTQAGYRRMLLCDNLYLKEEWIESAIAIIQGITKDY